MMASWKASADQSSPRLLIVDDDALQEEALRDILSSHGFAVEGCRSPSAALQRVGEARFNLVLTDLQMPEMNGIELTKRLQACDPDLVVVLMTGHATIPSIVDAMRNGAIDCIQKPFRASSLLPVIDRALEVQGLRQKNRQLEAALQQQVHALKAVNLELDAFAARLAHDLRSPLVSMRGILDLAREDIEQARLPDLPLVQQGVKSADLALRMVRDLLEFARLGDQPMVLKSVALDQVLKEALALVLPLAEGRNLDWQIGPLPTINGHAGLLQQAFGNLLSNGLKYTQGKQSPYIKVSADLTADGAWYEVCFEDNGAGFDPRLSDQLFKPFRRLHSANDFVGEGMGLANVRRIVERHGGSVRAKGSPGQGARFTLVFPSC